MLILFTSFLILLLVGFPISFSLGISSLLYLLAYDIPLVVFPQKLFAGLDVFVLLCIPGFILAGNLMNKSGATDKIIDFSNSLFGHITGGLSLANIGSSMVFSGISGTAVADSASIGGVMIPAMKKEGYDAAFSSAITSISSTIGPIIPPSLPMIIVGTLTGLSVTKLFIAGAIPGLILAIVLMCISYFISKKNNYPKGNISSFKTIFLIFKKSILSLFTIPLILFGILAGVFTPTEASIIASLYIFFIGIFFLDLKIKDLYKILIETMISTSSIMILVAFANVFAWILASEQIPQQIANFFLSITNNKYIMLFLINILLLFVGTFMETIAALVILFPILLKVSVSVGVDPIHFAVIAVLNLMIGLSTPPVGICLFVTSSIGKVSLEQITKAIVPFLFGSLIVLFVVTYFPEISLFLVNSFYK